MGMASLLRDGFVEVEDGGAGEGPGCLLDRVESGRVRGIARGDQAGCSLGVPGEVGAMTFDALEEDGFLGRRGRAAQHGAEELSDAMIRARGFGSDEAGGEDAGGLDVGGVIEEEQRLQWGVGAGGTDGTGLAVGNVEEDGGPDDAAPEEVEAPAVKGGAGIALVPLVAEGGFLPDAVRLVGADRWTADGFDEQPRRGKGGVADHPGGEALARATGEESVGGIGGEVLAGCHRGLPVGGAGDDEALDMLQVPSGFHEFAGQPVQEIGVGRALGLESEVFRGADESGAEEELPLAVDDHACGQGMRRVEEPAGEFEAVGGVWLRVGCGVETSRDARRDRACRLVVLATDELEGVAVGA